MDDHQSINGCRLGFALGIIGSLAVLTVAWAGAVWGYGLAFTNVLSSIYLGLQPTWLGGIIGAIWAFVDLWIAGWLFAWIYNCCGKKCSRSSNA